MLGSSVLLFLLPFLPRSGQCESVTLCGGMYIVDKMRGNQGSKEGEQREIDEMDA